MQVTWTADGPVRQRLGGGKMEYLEGKADLGTVGETPEAGRR